jgi:hypothetical protein
MMVPRFQGYTLDNDILLRYNNKICVPPNLELINLILSEAHHVVYMAHPRVTKMKVGLEHLFFWKNEIRNYQLRGKMSRMLASER